MAGRSSTERGGGLRWAGLATAEPGAANAVAGGGTLVSFPAMTAAGVPTVAANATNTVALCPGYIDGAQAQRRHLAGHRPLSASFWPS